MLEAADKLGVEEQKVEFLLGHAHSKLDLKDLTQMIDEGGGIIEKLEIDWSPLS